MSGAEEPARAGCRVTGDIDRVHGAVLRVVLDNPQFRKSDPHLSGELGIGVPAAVRGLGILDTGASMSCVDSRVASQLSLLEVDAVEMRGVRAAHETNRDAHSRVRYGVLRIDGVPGGFSTRLVEVRPLGDIEGEPVILLVGRDVLEHAVLSWDGPNQRFSLTFSTEEPVVRDGT